MSQSDLRLHFGLSQERRVDRIEIEWARLNLRETLPNVVADQFVTITEGQGVTDARSRL